MRLRAIGDSDWPRLKDFIARHFGFSHVPERAFNRHWFSNPFHGGWAAMALERPDGAFAGVMMFIVVPCWLAGRQTRLGWISNGVVEEDAQRTGEGAKLYLWAYRTFPVVGAMSGNDVSGPINALMGEEVPGLRMRRFVRLHDRRAMVMARPDQAERLAAMAIQPADAPDDVQAGWRDDIPDDYDPLWHRFRAPLVCTTDRTSDYFRWRYSAPHIGYRFVEVRREGELVGLAVVRLQQSDFGPVCRITELVTEAGWGGATVRAVAALAAEAGALFSDFMVIGSCMDDALAAGGFLPADPSTGLDAIPHLLAPLEHRQWTNTFFMGGREARRVEGWRSPDAVYFTKGDSDRDWPTLHDLDRIGFRDAD